MEDSLILKKRKKYFSNSQIDWGSAKSVYSADSSISIPLSGKNNFDKFFFKGFRKKS